MIAARSRTALAHAFTDTWVITSRDLLRNLRMPQLVLFATVQPVMFLLLFNYVFGGSIGRSASSKPRSERCAGCTASTRLCTRSGRDCRCACSGSWAQWRSSVPLST